MNKYTPIRDTAYRLRGFRQSLSAIEGVLTTPIAKTPEIAASESRRRFADIADFTQPGPKQGSAK